MARTCHRRLDVADVRIRDVFLCADGESVRLVQQSRFCLNRENPRINGASRIELSRSSSVATAKNCVCRDDLGAKPVITRWEPLRGLDWYPPSMRGPPMIYRAVGLSLGGHRVSWGAP